MLTMPPDAHSASLEPEISWNRILYWTVALSAIAASVALWRSGPAAAASFVVGAIASYFNFQLLHGVVSGMGPDAIPASRRVFWIFVFRYLALGLLGYATVKFSGVSPVSFCVGLLMTTAAFLLDSLTELIYARA